METLQQQYWAQYEEAMELLQTGSAENVEKGLDLCLDLRRRIDLGLLLRAMANASLAMYSESSANKADYANECLDLATMMHEQAPDDDTGWLVDTAQELVKRMAKTDISWEGQFTKHWGAAKEAHEAREDTATASAALTTSSEIGEDETVGESQSSAATTFPETHETEEDFGA
ncbi:hypothetical protein PV05_05741 [Exophiala xenobiotica]|uniref:Uncharacterized protein n=1 Tax=Exophiala xenobiotica TaxID=348802 RepID=A0A0D2FAT7_9EURO|nr:uncharacterized protein PV05_05741 [Exophiala xenobiotica]KIW57149.1 hypothetical protein PV05_05741 [Exophiala xenobiotica]